MMADSRQEEYCRAHWGPLVERERRNAQHHKKRADDAWEKTNELNREAEVGRAFLKMIKATNENMVVKSAWDKFMATLRLAGYDQ
jgi:hypothetical protein